MKRKEEQVSVLGEVDRFTLEREKREERETIARLDSRYERMDYRKLDWENAYPEGTVVIIGQNRCSNGRWIRHFYRAVLGYHHTVNGPMAHLVADPSEEWPERVPWGGIAGHPDWPKWIYPHYGHLYWVTGEVVEPIPLPY